MTETEQVAAAFYGVRSDEAWNATGPDLQHQRPMSAGLVHIRIVLHRAGLSATQLWARNKDAA